MATITAPGSIGLTSASPRMGTASLVSTACVLLGGVGLSLALLPQRLFMDLPRELVVWATFTILFVLMAAGYIAARSFGQSPWIAPVSLLGIYFFMRYGWGTVVANYWENYPWQAYPALRWNFHRFGVWEYLPIGCHLILVFGTGMLLGSLLASNRRTLILPKFSWPLSDSRLKGMAILYAPVATVINSFLQFGLPASIRFIVQLFGSFVYPLIMLGTYWLCTARTAQEKIQWSIYLVFCCALTVPVGLVTGQVNGMFMPFVVMILGYIIAKGSPPWKIIVFAMPLVFLMLLPFSALYKLSRTTSPYIQQRLENAASRFNEVGYRGRFELSLERTVMRFSGSNMPSLYGRFYPNVYSYEFGKSFAIEASTIVPRILWPQKPFGAWELNKYPARIGIVQYEGNTTALFDAISEYYLNFGAVGMFLLAIVHGYYWQSLYRWLSAGIHPLLGAILVLTLISQNEDFYGIGLLFTSMIKSVPVWLMLFYFFSRRARPAYR
jgi:hypothetical protein